MDFESTAESLDAIEALEDELDRPGWLGELEITVTPRRTPTLEDVEAYEHLGVDRRVLLLPQTGPAAGTDFLESIADELFDDEDEDDDD